MGIANKMWSFSLGIVALVGLIGLIYWIGFQEGVKFEWPEEKSVVVQMEEDVELAGIDSRIDRAFDRIDYKLSTGTFEQFLEDTGYGLTYRCGTPVYDADGYLVTLPRRHYYTHDPLVLEHEKLMCHDIKSID